MIPKITLLFLAIFNTIMSIYNNNVGNERLAILGCLCGMFCLGYFIFIGLNDAFDGKGFWH